MLKTESNPGGLPIGVFDGFREALAGNRAQFFLDVPTGPFYGFNRPGATVEQGVRGSAKAHYDGIAAFSESDQSADLQACPRWSCTARTTRSCRSTTARVCRSGCSGGTLKIYPGYSHGMLTVHADVLNADLLAFVAG